jgi:hypothetical protein
MLRDNWESKGYPPAPVMMAFLPWRRPRGVVAAMLNSVGALVSDEEAMLAMVQQISLGCFLGRFRELTDYENTSSNVKNSCVRGCRLSKSKMYTRGRDY